MTSDFFVHKLFSFSTAKKLLDSFVTNPQIRVERSEADIKN